MRRLAAGASPVTAARAALHSSPTDPRNLSSVNYFISPALLGRCGVLAGGFLMAVLLGGCSSLGYYWQSINGQLELIGKRRPIAELIAAEDTAPALRERLVEVLEIRDFATRTLHLPDNDSYRLYADLARPAAVWNVFAAPEFSLELRRWCFLLVGCLAYRGYFSEDQARAFAARQGEAGDEVYVAGVPAYSTLGWFDDPVLNTFVSGPLHRVAGLIFHELAHQLLYVKGDSAFSEGFASTVQREGLRRWLAERGDAEALAAHRREQERRQALVDLLREGRGRLLAIYESTSGEEGKRAQKRAVKDWMRERYTELRAGWGGYRGYNAWFAGELNNAQLGSVALYEDLVPAFERLLGTVDGDLPRFYAAAAALAALEPGERNARLRELSAGGPGSGNAGAGGSARRRPDNEAPPTRSSAAPG